MEQYTPSEAEKLHDFLQEQALSSHGHLRQHFDPSNIKYSIDIIKQDNIEPVYRKKKTFLSKVRRQKYISVLTGNYRFEPKVVSQTEITIFPDKMVTVNDTHGNHATFEGDDPFPFLQNAIALSKEGYLQWYTTHNVPHKASDLHPKAWENPTRFGQIHINIDNFVTRVMRRIEHGKIKKDKG